MKKRIYLLATVALLLIGNSDLFSQDRKTVIIRQQTEIPDTLDQEQMQIIVDSILASRKSGIDSTLLNADIFMLLKSHGPYSNPVTIRQSDALRNAFYKYIADNEQRSINGYRIRIFFDNSQSARADSKETEMRFIVKYPEIRTYRTYSNPYFKVTVGDFRNKSEAIKFLEQIKGEFPSAFMVKEKIFQ